MLPRERVLQVIRHRKPDRIPIHAWLRANLEREITAEFGSLEELEDHYEFDLAHAIGDAASLPEPYDFENVIEPIKRSREHISPDLLLDLPMTDPDEKGRYEGLRKFLRHHQERRGRFVYVQTPGIFEPLNKVFGIERHLLYLVLHKRLLREVYRRQAEWNRAFAMNCLDLGADMIHVSDDWGAQRGLMFSPNTWWDMIFPYHKVTTDAVRARRGRISLHSDGNISAVTDGIVNLGYQVVHPWQESAGMSLNRFKTRNRGRLTLMGGLDVQRTLGFGDTRRVHEEIERVMNLFADGGLVFCTTHYVQSTCSMEECVFALDRMYDLSRKACA